MKRDPQKRAALRALFALASLPGAALAQSAPDAAEPAPDPVEMSPFVVSTETERGYQPTATISATRIKTDIKDVGASIDVLTEQFLNDVGATDMWDGMKYVANVEPFTGRADDDPGNNAQWFSAPYISRGLRTDSVRLDFFPTSWVPIDRYNTESLTFLRGPNAILFGIGSPAGIIGATTKRPIFGKNSAELGYITDDNDSQRFELDVNQVLLKDRLAVRVAAVSSEKHTFREGSLVERDAVYAAVTFKPFSRTKITVNYEDGIYNRVHEQSLITADAYTPWVLAGRPTVNWMTGAGQTAPGKGNFATAATTVGAPFTSQGTGKKLVYIEGTTTTTGTVMDWNRMAAGAQYVPPATSAIMNSSDLNALASNPFNENTNVLTDPVTGQTWRLDLAAQAFGSLRRNDTDYDRTSVFIEQNLLRDDTFGNLDIELAWNEQENSYVFDNFGTGTRIEVDPNELLPNGAPNPNVGRPYIETANPDISREKHVIESLRGTLAYSIDLEDRKIFRNIGLGSYSLMGLYEEIRDDSWHIFSRLADTDNLVDPATGANIHDPRLAAGNNTLIRRYYLQPGDSYYQFSGPRLLDANGLYITEQNGVITRQLTDRVHVEEVVAGTDPRRAYVETESKVWAAQGFWWKAREGYYRIKGLYGQREDTQRKSDMAGSFTLSRDPVTLENAVDIHDFGSVERAGRWKPETSVEATTETYNIILQPHRIVSVFYNYSDVFNATAGNFVDIYENPLRPAYGDTQDYGVKLDLLGGRVYITATYYETAITDRSVDQFGSGDITTRLNQIWDSIREAARAAGDSANETKAEAGRFDIRPWGYRDDSTEGYEFSLVASLTRNWHVRLTAGSQETTISKLYDELPAYISDNQSYWDGYANSPVIWPTPNALPRDADGDGVIEISDAFTSLQQLTGDSRALLGQRPSDQRKYNASFFTNYNFSAGVLKGLRVGGGFRWASENIIGYARDADHRLLDPNKPFEGDQQFNTDLVIGYSRKFGDVVWDVQLNVFNVLDDDSIEAKQAVDDGTGNPIVVRTFMKAPRSFQLSTSIKF